MVSGSCTVNVRTDDKEPKKETSGLRWDKYDSRFSHVYSMAFKALSVQHDGDGIMELCWTSLFSISS